MRKALIVGISGQDGSYLAKLLIEKGYEVHGTSRDAELSSFWGLKELGIFSAVTLYSMTLIDFRSVMQTVLQILPDEIYNLAGQTSVGLSFLQPVETLESISIGTLNLLEVLRFHNLKTKLYNACSSECFGDTNGVAASEETAFRPRSPYAVAKAASFWQVSNYREAYNLFACSGILFNHESPLRPKRFVTKKIISAACRISLGSTEKLKLGNLHIKRDWGWAPEFVEGMHRILQYEKPEDFVLATGKNISLEQFVEKSFSYFNLDYNKFVEFDSALSRPTDIEFSLGNPDKAEKLLEWKAVNRVDEVIKMMIESELSELKSL